MDETQALQEQAQKLAADLENTRALLRDVQGKYDKAFTLLSDYKMKHERVTTRYDELQGCYNELIDKLIENQR